MKRVMVVILAVFLVMTGGQRVMAAGNGGVSALM